MIRLPLALLVLAAPAMADTSVLSLPQTCEAYLTAQHANCVVTHYVTCAGDPPGQQTVFALYVDGGDLITVQDADAQWLTTVDALNDAVETLSDSPADPAKLSELLDDGRDTYDFTTVMQDGTVTRYVGKERLTGQTITIDGIVLEEALNEIVVTNGAGEELWRGSGTEYVSRDWRLYFPGVTDWVMPTETYQTDERVVDFAFPNEPGFLASSATTGCY